MFVIKYDKLSMVKLVQSIERYPPIYDIHTNYTRDEQEEAWENVSKEVGEKDILCRDRWHSIKSCYIRHLKYTALNSSRKPYYLSEYLEFLLPHVSERIKRFLSLQEYDLDNLPSYLKEALPSSKQSLNSILAPKTSKSHETKIKEEAVDVEEVAEGWLGMEVITSSQQSSSKQRSPKKSNRSSSSTSRASVKPVNQANTNANDEDVTFFKSLLPDIARMSSHQKLKFKQETLSIIEDILYAHDDVNITD